MTSIVAMCHGRDNTHNTEPGCNRFGTTAREEEDRVGAGRNMELSAATAAAVAAVIVEKRRRLKKSTTAVEAFPSSF
jgi:hypothetical protein